MTSLLHYSLPAVDEDDIIAVTNALRSNFLTTGPRVAEFESAFAKETGAAFAVVCNSGTAALHLTMLGLALTPGDAVVVPAITFLSTANVVRMTGADVVFADVDAQTGLMTPDTFDAALYRSRANKSKIRAAIPVHLNGRLCNMETLAGIASPAGISICEDACHALGVELIGAARHSQAACFSTHAVKAITTGEGGMVTTNDPELAHKIRQLRTHGITREVAEFTDLDLAFDEGNANLWYYEMSRIGWNYRLPDILCALGTSQLRKLQRFHSRRRELAALYDRLLAPLAPTIHPVSPADTIHGWHLYAVLIDFAQLGTTRRAVMERLRGKGIGTQVHYIPVHLQPYYRQLYGRIKLSGAESYYSRCLTIPMFPNMTDDDVHRVAESLADLVES
jgi:UDP-4-amino-4,6-dideoxy-N-acetyl-beta-L-altrosamine transaminase